MTAPGHRIALSAHIEIEWLTGRTVWALCPNCGSQGEVRQVLDIEYSPPVGHDDKHRFMLQVCPNCTSRFVDNMTTMEFHSGQQMERGEDAFHVQLGAGLWPITGQIARLDKPRGAKVLEIGGAYGFGLDFALRARGWDGVGYDPSPFAAVGMRELALPLRQEYFTERHLALGPWDVAIATELLEHISHPAAFLLLMRRALTQGGVLMLSTPNAECIGPEQPVSNLLPLLSPGSHAVLQTRRSLELALDAAGFAHTHIIEDGLSLTAYASAEPIRLVEDVAVRRGLYRRHLVERAELAGPTSDLRFGFAGRGIFEAVNDGDWAAADAAWAALLPATQARFGLDLESMTALPPGAETASLAELVRLIPLGLGMILFGRSMRLLAAGASRGEVEPKLRLALGSIEQLMRALAEHSLQDALSANMAGLLRTELLICDAAAGRAEVVEGLAALGDEATSWRGFVELVNAGAIEVATALRATLPELPEAAMLAGLRRNALLSLVNFYLAPGQDALLVLPVAKMLRAGGEVVDEALFGIFIRLVNAARYDDARECAAGVESLLTKLRPPFAPIAQDALVSLVSFHLATGTDMVYVKPSVEALLASGGNVDEVLFGVFSRLVNAARYDDAHNWRARVDPLLLKLRPPFTLAAQDALFAAGILFLQHKQGWIRGAASFSRLRDGLIKQTLSGGSPGPLFWPAVRGEVIALNYLNREVEAALLLQNSIDLYHGAPDDLREQLSHTQLNGKKK
jgi:SAM-dependent methyltransferase